jgi:hypothetical protein
VEFGARWGGGGGGVGSGGEGERRRDSGRRIGSWQHLVNIAPRDL